MVPVVASVVGDKQMWLFIHKFKNAKQSRSCWSLVCFFLESQQKSPQVLRPGICNPTPSHLLLSTCKTTHFSNKTTHFSNKTTHFSNKTFEKNNSLLRPDFFVVYVFLKDKSFVQYLEQGSARVLLMLVCRAYSCHKRTRKVNESVIWYSARPTKSSPVCCLIKNGHDLQDSIRKGRQW